MPRQHSPHSFLSVHPQTDLGQAEADRSSVGPRRFSHILSNQILKIESNVGQHLSMLPGLAHALSPGGAAVLRATQLPRQDGVERLHLLLGPLDASAHHGWRKAALEAADRVADDGKVDQ